jgi:hypothetical protein
MGGMGGMGKGNMGGMGGGGMGGGNMGRNNMGGGTEKQRDMDDRLQKMIAERENFGQAVQRK